jgi:hypothetical protein
MTCINCDKTDGQCYTSLPPKVRCTVTGKFHLYDDPAMCNLNPSSKRSGSSMARIVMSSSVLIAIQKPGMR